MSETLWERNERLWPARQAWGARITADHERIFSEARDVSHAIVASDVLRDASIGAAAGAGLGWLVGSLPGAGTGALIGAVLGWVKNIGSNGRIMEGLFEEPYDSGMYLRPGAEHDRRYGVYPE
ncbi:MAG: hypothetical protein KBC74_00710 [Candidatus Pacebacteria bacterium]|nr:hypothetical protein [Candidatus Paceibacterota bacterium]MBP9832034.1 hypothetical protein [Candidatus Paceibacterota bacterium]